MKLEAFKVLVQTSIDRQHSVMWPKMHDYATSSGDDEALRNFKRNGERLGIDPLMVWAIYASKHWDTIMGYVQSGRVESEAIEDRFTDLHNYLYLGEALVREARQLKHAELQAGAKELDTTLVGIPTPRFEMITEEEES